METKRITGLLGICRRAGRLLIGHDAVKESIVKEKAVLVIIASDASERLCREMGRLTDGKNIKVLSVPLSSDDFYSGIGKKASVFSITDEGFANKTELMFGEA